MWELDCEESWVLKNWCFWTVVLEKTLEGPLDCKEIQPVHTEGDQPWDFFGRNDAEAETPVLWPPHVKSWLIGKDSDAGRDWGQEEKGTTENEMAGWHHWLDGRESEWTLGVGDGQGSLGCCASWARRVGHDWAPELNWMNVSMLLSPYLPAFPSPFKCLLKKFLPHCMAWGVPVPWLGIEPVSPALESQNLVRQVYAPWFCLVTPKIWSDRP